MLYEHHTLGSYKAKKIALLPIAVLNSCYIKYLDYLEVN